ncbi:hypothetical protein OG921_04875 [Aldersonia sp. NBC_00410]|uniref:DUF6668 family protein n=1 Tax=Aldersonia sp. NBC_00410 TaxID=2975954 RepID=UPI002256360D|nr:DUF6668 family protein [Aldersonia sp. NBC_00410]MCX5042505.1 hypothetical protein [Aldersonia sp. NBC_00410]
MPHPMPHAPIDGDQLGNDEFASADVVVGPAGRDDARMTRLPDPDAAGAGFAVRAPQFRLPVWDRPVPHGQHRSPAVWLLGAHGGAGVSTLAHVLAPAGEAGGRWPAHYPEESPFVILVARETVPGLLRAHGLLRQHAAGLAGPARVLGLVTVADRPGRIPAAVRQTRDLAAGLVEHAWRVAWIEQYPLTHDVTTLPVWSPLDPPPVKPAPKHTPVVPREVTALGAAIHDALRTALDFPDTPPRSTRERRSS